MDLGNAKSFPPTAFPFAKETDKLQVKTIRVQGGAQDGKPCAEPAAKRGVEPLFKNFKAGTADR